jgi:hypothetical protein
MEALRQRKAVGEPPTHDDWDRPRCSICVAGRSGALDLLRIEKLLADRSRMAFVAPKFEVSYDALRRHWLGVSAERKNYLQRGRQLSKEALAAELAEEKLSTIDHLRIVRGGLHRLFCHAVEINDHSGGAALAGAIEKNVRSGALLAGEWQPGPAVQNNVTIFNVPGTAQVLAGIGHALAAYPDARHAVVEYLRQAQPAAPPMIELQNAAAD